MIHSGIHSLALLGATASRRVTAVTARRQLQLQKLYYLFFRFTLEKLDLFHSMAGNFNSRMFPEYFCNISIPRETFPYISGNISLNWTKLWKLDFPTIFYDIFKILLHTLTFPIFPVSTDLNTDRNVHQGINDDVMSRQGYDWQSRKEK